ncbi:MAG: hypothetical protein FWF88_12370, partial [Peptococcaceae bacterium]|nr:hypothetical protein [Peptococcaceae bacterium]
MQRVFDDATRQAFEEAIDISLGEILSMIEKVEAYRNKYPNYVVPALETKILPYFRRLHYFQSTAKIKIEELYERVEATDLKHAKDVQENGLKTELLRNKIIALGECYQPPGGGDLYPMEIVAANFGKVRETISLMNAQTMQDYYTNTGRWTELLAKPWDGITADEYRALALIYTDLMLTEEAPYTNLLTFWGHLLDPRPEAPGEWDINLSKIAIMAQYLDTDIINPYDILKNIWGEPENLTKLQAMAKSWEIFKDDPGFGGLMRSIGGSLTTFFDATDYGKSNIPDPAHILDGIIKG